MADDGAVGREAAVSRTDALELASAVDILSTRWTLPILFLLVDGEKSFTALRRGIPGVSPNLLTKRLRALEERGIVEKVQPLPGWSGYALTPRGLGLGDVCRALERWCVDNA